MGKGTIRLVLGAVVVLAPVLTTPMARSEAGTPCAFDFILTASPGLTASPSSGSETTHGENGAITCDGPVNGKQPTGSGTDGFEGHYGTKKPYSCQDEGQGEGDQSITIPRAGGVEHFINHLTYAHGPYHQGQLFSGSIEGDRMSGTFEAEPMDGDCVSKPMTKFHIRGKGTLR
jgi:hypothetical protein